VSGCGEERRDRARAGEGGEEETYREKKVRPYFE